MEHNTKVKVDARKENSGDPLKSREMDSMLTKCKEIALKKELHGWLVNDQVMSGFLVYCLGEEDEKRVLNALNSIHLLVLNPENGSGLRKVIMLNDALKTTVNKKTLSPQLREYAACVYKTAKECMNPCEERDMKTRVTGPRNSANGSVEQLVIQKTARVSKFYSTMCASEHTRLWMTNCLVKVPGVISITYDIPKKFCLVRAKGEVPPGILAKAIGNLGFATYFVAKDQKNEEVLVKIPSDVKVEAAKETLNEQESLPDYPDYSDSDTEDPEKARIFGYAAKKDDKNTGWVSKASKFLQNCFYW